ncbi:hypothetical protein AVEN_178824-1 [Araneus ventricosus]|uniref:Uncharacterized protein n=1 Tax=Araneus ventricosus TaxID=182803 RepID=A0A4Y2BGX3_ARAVE|nr:hypothetical protein AVEN_178824-1 [Araneus ventricosus]
MNEDQGIPFDKLNEESRWDLSLEGRCGFPIGRSVNILINLEERKRKNHRNLWQVHCQKCFKLDCHGKASKAHLGHPKYKSRDNGLGPTREWSKSTLYRCNFPSSEEENSLYYYFFCLWPVLCWKVLINNGQRARFQLLDINIASSVPQGPEAIIRECRPSKRGSLNGYEREVCSEDWSSNGASDYRSACFNFRNLLGSPFITVMKWPSEMKGSFN